MATLYSRENRLVAGGAEAFDSELSKLRGRPVVVNVWASWCEPCREEFPLFQQAVAGLGTRVAFLGVNSQDGTDAARTFLGEYPIPYPSFEDPGGDLTTKLGVTRGLPGTAFYDSRGNLVYTKQGQYTSESELVADIKRYAE